jgi:hypothetical protein
MSSIYRLLLSGSFLFGLLAATMLAGPDGSDLWVQAVFNWLHVPVFGLVAGCLFVITPSRWDWRFRIAATAGSAVALGVATEAVQTTLPTRNASIDDLISDVIGVAVFLGLLISLAPCVVATRNTRICVMLLSATLLCWSLYEPAKMSMAYLERSRQVPSIIPVRSRQIRFFIALQNTSIGYVTGQDGKSVIPEFRFDDKDNAKIEFHDPWPDWSGYETLLLEVTNLDSAPLSVTLRIHDREHLRGDRSGSDRFRRRLNIPPGRHALKFSMQEIEHAPVSRPIDLTQIEGVVIFRSGKGAARRFRIHDLRLE